VDPLLAHVVTRYTALLLKASLSVGLSVTLLIHATARLNGSTYRNTFRTTVYSFLTPNFVVVSLGGSPRLSAFMRCTPLSKAII